jgi:hypothetical protein
MKLYFFLLGAVLAGCSAMLPQTTEVIYPTSSSPMKELLLPPEWTETPSLTTTPTITISPSPTQDPRETGERYYEVAGNYSYIIPEGWSLGTIIGTKFRVLFGKQVDNFVPKVIFTDEEYPGTLEKYLQESLKSVTQIYPKLSCKKPQKFTTNAGKDSLKMVCQNSLNNVWYSQILYAFENGSRKMVATYSRLLNKQKENDPLIDACMHSFRFEN